jgi:hypothetical protein
MNKVRFVFVSLAGIITTGWVAIDHPAIAAIRRVLENESEENIEIPAKYDGEDYIATIPAKVLHSNIIMTQVKEE